MKRKKIAFVAVNCTIGGVETALINLLNIIDTTTYDISLYTNFSGNPVIGRIPAEIKCIDLDEYGIKQVFQKALSKGRLFQATKLFANYTRFRLEKEPYHKMAWRYRHISFKHDKFDCVIAYNYGVTTLYLVNECFLSDRRVVWIHGELPSEFRPQQYLDNLATANHCFCVSRSIQNYFLGLFPTLALKTELFYNIINESAVKEKSSLAVTENINKFDYSIVTVGRLGTDKGQEVIPETAKRLKESGVSFAWFIVGDGRERQNIENEIQRIGTEDCVFLLGAKENPFPYMKQCTIYVQTSKSEGWCLTTQEARILHKPCVVTDIPVMHEQFTDGVNGIIANGTDAAALYEGIMRLIRSPELMNQIVQQLETHPQGNANEIQKLYDYIES